MIHDPYTILGVSPSASDEEIKKAYRACCRKYHPDLHMDSPDKDTFEQKFREIQEAYQQIMDQRSGASSGFDSSYGFGGSNRSAAYGSGTDEASMHKRAAVNYVQNNRFAEALNVLDTMSYDQRDAEWYYIHAFANNGLRNHAAALQDAQTALQMDPGNPQYQMLVQRLSANSYSYQNMQAPYMSGGSLGSDCVRCCAANLICNLLASCCCRC